MLLNILERIMSMSLLPREEDFATLKIVRDARGILSPTEEEIIEFEIRTEGNETKWNKKGQEEREIKLSKAAERLIAEALLKLNNEKKLTEDHLSIYEKFVE